MRMAARVSVLISFLVGSCRMARKHGEDGEGRCDRGAPDVSGDDSLACPLVPNACARAATMISVNVQLLMSLSRVVSSYSVLCFQLQYVVVLQPPPCDMCDVYMDFSLRSINSVRKNTDRLPFLLITHHSAFLHFQAF